MSVFFAVTIYTKLDVFTLRKKCYSIIVISGILHLFTTMVDLSSCIAISQHPSKGKIVIATQSIQAGEIIEIAPAIAISEKTRELLKPTELFQYCFVNPDGYVHNWPVSGYFVLGLATLCNHSNQPNAKVNWVRNDKGNWSHLIALNEINLSEEILLFYTDFKEYESSSWV
ncbi:MULTISPECIES: SET domain-containing protein-lysine N-methyltransferase [Spirulina sp. CCY15215]|uniref:SET domain-containing protein-lysine N-methyltransferase n=1 Tax=Spirulina sp. CCY15215 TaxID=2767591 RepID=UPI00194E09CF|nr:SET domain-containing protein-lysine N-methyltransferase [Spirulina major]